MKSLGLLCLILALLAAPAIVSAQSPPWTLGSKPPPAPRPLLPAGAPAPASGPSLPASRPTASLPEPLRLKLRPTPPGLAMHLPCESIADNLARDVSGNRNHGRIAAVRLAKEGRIGAAYEFNGRDSAIEVPASKSLLPAGGFTFAAHVRLRPTYKPGPALTIISRYIGRNCDGIGVLEITPQGRPTMVLSRNGMTYCTDTDLLSPDAWHFLVGTFDGKGVCLYVDGRLKHTVPHTLRGMALQDVPVVIGRHLDGANPMDGWIDEAMVLRRAISAEQVQGLYQRHAGELLQARIARRAQSDVVTLTSGTVLAGRLQQKDFTLTTNGREITLPIARLAGLLADTASKDVWLLLADGQVIRGKAAKDTIAFELSMGSLVNLPLAKVRQLALRKSAAAASTQPAGAMVVLADGQRLLCQIAPSQLTFQTACGHFDLATDDVVVILPRSDGRPVATLANGSVLLGGFSPATVRLATSLAGKLDIDARQIMAVALPRTRKGHEDLARITLADDQVIFCRPTGTLPIHGELGRLDVPLQCAVKAHWLGATRLAARDLLIKLSDKTELRGRPLTQTISIDAGQNRPLKIPVSLIRDMTNPHADLPPQIATEVDRLISQLGSDSFARREAATKALIGMGPMVIRSLRKHTDDSDPEIRQRTRRIIRTIDPAAISPGPPGPGPNAHPFGPGLPLGPGG